MVKHRAGTALSERATRFAKTSSVAAGMIGGAVVLAIGATGGTFALLSDRTDVPAATIESGAVGLTINDVTSYAISGLDVTALLPGRSVGTATPLTLKNTGVTPLSITAGTTVITDASGTLASELIVAVHHTASCTLTPVGTTAASFSTPIVLAPNATATVCVEVQLKSTAPATVRGRTAGFSIPLNAVQVAP
jgi:hypothetical protein